jgi:hypothetical protein
MNAKLILFLVLLSAPLASGQDNALTLAQRLDQVRAYVSNAPKAVARE